MFLFRLFKSSEHKYSNFIVSKVLELLVRLVNLHRLKEDVGKKQSEDEKDRQFYKEVLEVRNSKAIFTLRICPRYFEPRRSSSKFEISKLP